MVSPLGGDKWLVKNVFVIESVIQKNNNNTKKRSDKKKMLIHPEMKQVKYLSESLNHSFKPIFNFNITNLCS